MFTARERIFAVTPDTPHWTSGESYKGTRSSGVCGFALDRTKDFSDFEHHCDSSPNLAQLVEAVKTTLKDLVALSGRGVPPWAPRIV